ncbi:MAG TPA: ParB N-terminal domain-containing protein [bacterium]|nr:ParB N-terminal domain-containing protein [bacterium]
MAASELKPELRLVPTQHVRFHEHAERRRTERLMARIKADAQLRNPPVVAEMDNGHYLLLDGANRVSAFLELGYSHIPVQVVDYGDHAVQLKGWHHLLLDGGTLRLHEAYQALPDVQVRPVTKAQLAHLLELREVYAVLVENERAWWGIFPAQTQRDVEVHQRIRTLEAIVSAYEGQSRLERVKLADYEQLPLVIQGVQHQLCLFPVLRKEELLHLAAEGVMIPTGLTRHIIPGRALAINVDLAFIVADTSEAEKQKHFKAFVDQLSIEGRIRFYEESVFIMNE